MWNVPFYLFFKLDLANCILSVGRRVIRSDGELVVTEPKTKNSVRKVAIPKQTMELLVREHDQHPDNPILFPSPRTGGCWSSGAVSRINKKTAEGGGNR